MIVSNVKNINKKVFIAKASYGIRYHYPIKVLKRFMMSSRCMYAARSFYHAATLLSNSDTINNFTKKNTSPFVKDIVKYTLDDTKGIVQHKTAIFKHLTSQKFPGEQFYESFIDQTNITIVKYEPHVHADFRTLNELKSLSLYLENYQSDIGWIYATLDARSATFPNAHQSNLDFWVYIDRGFGFRPKVTYQDDKSGMEMLKHSSKGSIGVISYDHKGENIQMTAKPIDDAALIVYNKVRLQKLQLALAQDNLLDDRTIKDVMFKAHQLQNDMTGKSFNEISTIHSKIQTLLWNQIQCNPQFSQSVSFVFLKQIINQPLTNEEVTFSKNFQSKLQPNKMYDLNTRGDLNELYKAFIYAGNQMDPLFIQKLYYWHNNGLVLNNSILSLLADFTKNGLS